MDNSGSLEPRARARYDATIVDNAPVAVSGLRSRLCKRDKTRTQYCGHDASLTRSCQKSACQGKIMTNGSLVDLTLQLIALSPSYQEGPEAL